MDKHFHKLKNFKPVQIQSYHMFQAREKKKANKNMQYWWNTIMFFLKVEIAIFQSQFICSGYVYPDKSPYNP
jgi:hypothetical protein